MIFEVETGSTEVISAMEERQEEAGSQPCNLACPRHRTRLRMGNIVDDEIKHSDSRGLGR